MSSLTNKGDVALPLRLVGFRSNLPLKDILNPLDPLRHVKDQPIIYLFKDGKAHKSQSYKISELLKHCLSISDEETAIKILPADHFVLMKHLDHFTFSFINEWVDPHDDYELPSNFTDFPYQGLFNECKHILELDIETIFLDYDDEIGQITDSPISEAQDQPLNVFRQTKTGTWEVSFNGKTYPALEDRAGFRYIRMLLGHPGKEFNASELNYSSVQDISGVAEVVEPEALTVVDSFSGSINRPDQTAQKQFRKRLERIKIEVEDAIKDGDEEEHRKLEEERESIIDELKKVRSARSQAIRRQPQDGSNQKKAQDNIYGNIKNAINYINDHIPELGQHFEESIRKGTINRYKPSLPTTWVVS